MSLANVAYAPVLTWANPTVRRLERQALVPMFGDATRWSSDSAAPSARCWPGCAAEPRYPTMFARGVSRRRRRRSPSPT